MTEGGMRLRRPENQYLRDDLPSSPPRLLVYSDFELARCLSIIGTEGCAGWSDGVWWRNRIGGCCLTIIEEIT